MEDVKKIKIELVTKKLFGDLEIECYVGTSVENGNFFMTRRQIGEALEYKSLNSFHKIIQRNSDVIGEAMTVDKKSTMIDKIYTAELYTFKQLFQILRFSKQPKANLFMDWAATTLEELVTNRAELKFKTQIDEDTYNIKMDELMEKAEVYDQILVAPNSQCMNSIAKSLNVGRNKLFAFLRKSKVLMKDNTPYQRFIKSDYFVVREQVIPTGELVPITYITGKGLLYIRKLLKKVDFNI